MENLILKLFEVEAVKFGTFTLKSGISSPIYFDLRVIISYPDILKLVSDYMWQIVKASKCDFKSLCGVPYTALPIATCMCVDHGIPMLIRRKEPKDYGTKKMIEGHFDVGDKCLIIEDVVTSGSSVLETVKSLNEIGVTVKDVIVLLDREQGGRKRLTDQGITLHSVCSITKLLEILEKLGKISSDVVHQVNDFISANREKTTRKKVYTHSERAALCQHPLTQKLLTIMDMKKTNLALSADVTSSKQLLSLADSIGPYICILKTHIDILDDFSPDVTAELRALADKHNFVIFEDRKFADIGRTVQHQLSSGIYHISRWADLVNAHPLPGPGIIDGLKQASRNDEKSCCNGCLLIAEMSSKGCLTTGEYTKKAIEMAEANSDFVIGYICQSRLTDNPQFLHMTPGVKLVEGGDSLGQQYTTPEDVIRRKTCDIIIVGRGITESVDPVATAIHYQQAGYAAYVSLFH